MTFIEIILIIFISVVSIIVLLNFLHTYLQAKITYLKLQLEIIQANERVLSLFNQWKNENKGGNERVLSLFNQWENENKGGKE